MTTHRIGITETAVATIDAARLVDTRMLIQANSGGGKSTLLRLLAERLAGVVPFIILDWEGEFITLRERADVVLVGADGEIATDAKTAGLLARKLVELSASAVIDLGDLEPDRKREYVRRFLESLIHLPRQLWRPTVVCIDEAHQFAPENGKAVSTQAVINLMSLGRKRGFCGVLSTQRLSKIHKDAVSECNNVLIGRTWLDVDQKRAGDTLGMTGSDRHRLRDLAEGTFYAFGPALSFAGVELVKADNAATRPPRVGERHTLSLPSASDAVRQIVSHLADLPQQAEEEIRDLEDAKRRIAQLEREAGEMQRPAKLAEPRVERVDVPVVTPEGLAAMNRAVEELHAGLEKFQDLVERATAFRDETLRKIDVPALRALKESRPALPRHVPRPTAPERPHAKAAVVHHGDDGVTAPQQRILDALQSFRLFGLGRVSKSNVAVFSDQSPTSSGFANNLGRLRSLGLIDYPAGGFVSLTVEGLERAESSLDIASLDGLHRAWFSKLPAPKVRILEQLIRVYPQVMGKNALADLAQQSATSSGYANNLGSLRSLGLIDYPQAGYVAATELLFPDGLR